MDRPLATFRCVVSAFADAVVGWFACRAADQHALWAHFRQRWYVYVPLILVWTLAQHFVLFNWTRSLPYSVVWLEPSTTFARGDLIVYRFDGEELMHLKKGQRFFKRIVGVPGDQVSVMGRRVFINRLDAGIAKRYTLDGHRLEPIEPCVIVPGYFFVQGVHEMSFDSRYRESGLVHVSQIVGKVHVIF
jgi:conjugal transfer pilin signal peptidase TrbI